MHAESLKVFDLFLDGALGVFGELTRGRSGWRLDVSFDVVMDDKRLEPTCAVRVRDPLGFAASFVVDAWVMKAAYSPRHLGEAETMHLIRALQQRAAKDGHG